MDERLAILLKHLPALRSEGVVSLEIDGIKLQLKPMGLEPQQGGEQRNKRDPETFGLPPSVLLPTLKGRHG